MNRVNLKLHSMYSNYKLKLSYNKNQMKLINSLNPKIIKLIFLINVSLVLFYSGFINYFDRDLIHYFITSEKIFFNYVLFKIVIGIFFFLNAVIILKIGSNKKWIWFIFISGLAARLILIPAHPVVEDDFYRYLWDGAVTANGVNPYEYSPKEALEENTEREVPEILKQLAGESGEIINNINHPHIRTIYPPVAQAIFAVCYFIFQWKIWGLKIFFLLFDLAALFLIYKLLKKYNKPLIFIFFYWMNPVVIHEFYAAAHMDILLFPFMLLILWFAISNSNLFSAIFLSIASGIKVWPVIFIPFVFRNLWSDKKKLLLFFILTAVFILIIFLPVLYTVFDKTLGFVTYAENWTNNEAVFKILHIIIKEINSLFGLGYGNTLRLTRWVTGFMFIIFLFVISKKKNENHEDYFEKFLIITAVLFFISPTQFPWYFSWVIPFLVFRPMVSLLLYPVLLPLYQLNYLSPNLVYIQHIPIIILFLYELKTENWRNLFTK